MKLLIDQQYLINEVNRLYNLINSSPTDVLLLENRYRQIHIINSKLKVRYGSEYKY